MNRKLLIAVAALAALNSYSYAQDAQIQTASNNPNNIIETFEVAQAGTTAPTASEAKAEPKSTGWKGPVGYPGNTWGTIYYNAGSKNRIGLYTPRWETQGVFEQGVDWFRFGDGTWKFNTYGALEYVINDQDKLFIPVLGMKVNKRFENGSLDLGIRVKSRNVTVGVDNPFGDGPETRAKKSATLQLFATYWFDWNLKKD